MLWFDSPIKRARRAAKLLSAQGLLTPERSRLIGERAIKDTAKQIKRK